MKILEKIFIIANLNKIKRHWDLGSIYERLLEERHMERTLSLLLRNAKRVNETLSTFCPFCT